MQQIELAEDGLPVLIQGPWSRDKLFFVTKFMEIFNAGMKNLWATRVYVDLFAGPGLCLDRETRQEFDGSPLCALKCRTPFTHMFLNDREDRFIDALKERQGHISPAANVTYSSFDCNAAARHIAPMLPKTALVLVFVDPWTYEITFDALACLAQHQYTDLIVTFHGGAIKRNAHHHLAAVDRFLGDPSWRDRYWSAKGDLSAPPTVVLLETFQSQLKARLGYDNFGDPEVIKNVQQTPMFHLLFASRHSRGLDFWQKASATMRSGQRTMF